MGILAIRTKRFGKIFIVRTVKYLVEFPAGACDAVSYDLGVFKSRIVVDVGVRMPIVFIIGMRNPLSLINNKVIKYLFVIPDASSASLQKQ